MIKNNKIYHEWMTEYVALINSVKQIVAVQEILKVLNKADMYKYRLLEVFTEEEFNKHLKWYVDKYVRLNQ